MSSKPQIKHYGKIVKGVLRPLNYDLWYQQLALLEGRDYELIIKERHRKPTSDQHGYYRGAVLGSCYQSEMFSYFDKPDDIHNDYFAPKFLSYTVMVKIVNPKTGEITQREQVKVRSMSDLDKKEVSEFIEKCIADAAINGITILSPEDYYTDQFKTKTI